MKELIEKWKKYKEWCNQPIHTIVYYSGAKTENTIIQPDFESFMEWLARKEDK